MVGLSVNDELEGIWTDFSNVFLEKLGKTMKNVCQSVPHPIFDLKTLQV
jgi:hypothetical protein